MRSKLIYIACFLVFGIGVGFVSVWFDNNTDTVFFLNLPGTLFGDGIYHRSIAMFGDPASSQAHFTIPWLFRVPQVYVPASAVIWGVLGTILAFSLRPRAILWIAGVYVVVLGILAVIAYVL